MKASQLRVGLGDRQLPLGIACRLLDTVLGLAMIWTFLGTGVAAAQPGQPKGADAPPPAVEVAAVVSKRVDQPARFIGTIGAIESVDLRARVEGFLEQVAFEQGTMVERGQLLDQIEQAPFQASLTSAEGQLAAARADLDGAKAALEDKQPDFERQSALIKKGDTSQTAFDQSKAARDEAQADVEKAQASVQQAEASVATAKINLDYTTIRSPIAGRHGRHRRQPGQQCQRNLGDRGSARLDPIRAVFSIPSAERVRLIAATRVDAEDARALFVPRLILPTGEEYPHPGKIAFSDNQVDASTGTVAIYADFPNPDQVLLPGQFVSAVVHRAEPKRLPTVPATAIQRTRDGEQVYVVDTDNRVKLRTISDSTRIGDAVAIGEGLQEGELIVVSGVQKIKVGMIVSTEQTPDSGTNADAAGGADESDGTAQRSPRSSSSGRAWPRWSRSCSSSPACWRYARSRSPSTPRSRRWSRSPPAIRAPMRRPSRTPSARRLRSRSTASRTCSTCRRRHRVPAATR
jgi:membrane fusion protein (multidrug efflux system)